MADEIVRKVAAVEVLTLSDCPLLQDISANRALIEAFNQAVEIIRNQGGEIINIGMTAQQSSHRVYTFRLSTLKTAAIEKALGR